MTSVSKSLVALVLGLTVVGCGGDGSSGSAVQPGTLADLNGIRLLKVQNANESAAYRLISSGNANLTLDLTRIDHNDPNFPLDVTTLGVPTLIVGALASQGGGKYAFTGKGSTDGGPEYPVTLLVDMSDKTKVKVVGDVNTDQGVLPLNLTFDNVDKTAQAVPGSAYANWGALLTPNVAGENEISLDIWLYLSGLVGGRIAYPSFGTGGGVVGFSQRELSGKVSFQMTYDTKTELPIQLLGEFDPATKTFTLRDPLKPGTVWTGVGGQL